MTRLLAIDPGNTESAYLLYDTVARCPLEWQKALNDQVLRYLTSCAAAGADLLAVEMIASYGMAVGREVFETCVAIGRFVERWNRPHRFVYRAEVKLHLCQSARAKDANVRQALLDRYGGKEVAVGRKATPGPLYGLSGDCWSALGVAITAAEVPA